jgi:hypothetical protein
MRQIDNRKLWLGHVGDLRDVHAILTAEIAAVVELAASEPPAILPRELVHVRFPLTDGGENPPWLLRLAVQTVASLLQAEVPTLVCCSAGMSRSIAVAAGGLALAQSRHFVDAVTIVVGTGPADVSPGLLAQVRDELDDSAWQLIRMRDG